jgi:quercetin dioxygenase-like cupin family protein
MKTTLNKLLIPRMLGKVKTMKIYNYQDLEAQEAEEGASRTTVRWLITKEMGAKNFAMRLFEIGVGGYSPYHSHSWEHEVFILEGEGLAIEKEEQKQFKAGDVIFIPQNEKHQFRNNGKKNVKFLCLIPYTDK